MRLKSLRRRIREARVSVIPIFFVAILPFSHKLVSTNHPVVVVTQPVTTGMIISVKAPQVLPKNATHAIKKPASSLL